MSLGQRISNFIPEYSENLLPQVALFDDTIPVNLTSGTAVFSFIGDQNFAGGKALFITLQSYKTTDIAFNFGGALTTTVNKSGNYIFSFRLLKVGNTAISFPPFTIYAKVFIDGINTDDIECHMSSDFENDGSKWVSFSQNISLNNTQTIDFSFYIDADLSFPFDNLNFYLDGLKLEYDDRFLGTPSIYSKPLVGYIEKGATGWESKTDTTNIISLTAATDNVMTLSATSDSNGGLTLLDSNSKIIPIQLNDVLSIDFACTFITPAGTERSIDVYLRVGMSFYRGYNYKLTKGASNSDFFSINWNLPCGVAVMANDVEIVLNPTSTMDYKDRYINVARTHKAI
jgi:hypothetical protein